MREPGRFQLKLRSVSQAHTSTLEAFCCILWGHQASEAWPCLGYPWDPGPLSITALPAFWCRAMARNGFTKYI